MSLDQLSDGGREAMEWMRFCGGDAGTALDDAGARFVHIRGEPAPFDASVADELTGAGLAEYVEMAARPGVMRYRLTDAGWSAGET